MKIHIVMFALFITAVIAILAADLMLGRMRDLPSAAVFRTTQVAILVIYLVLAVMLVAPPLLMVFAVPIALALLFAYLALGTAQATAIVAGLEERGIGRWRAWPIALLLAYLPVVGSAVAVQSATAMELEDRHRIDPLLRTARRHCGSGARVLRLCKCAKDMSRGMAVKCAATSRFL